MPPVSSLSWAENEVRFPVRFREEPDQAWLLRCAATARLLPLLHALLLCLSGKNKPGVCRLAEAGPNRHTPSASSTDPQLLELVDGSHMTNVSQ